MNDRWEELQNRVLGNGGSMPTHGQRTADGEDDDGEDAHGSRAYATVRGTRDRADTVELRFLAPGSPDQSLEYSLRRRMLWDKAKHAVTVEFVDGLKAVITGVGLFELKEKLRQRRVTWVQEQGADPVAMKAAELAAKEDGAAFVWVAKIEVKEPGDDAEA